MSRFFITGTDTDAGKTWASVQLLKFAASQGVNTLGLKPVAAGCYPGTGTQSGQWLNDDAVQLRAASTVQYPYAQHNPIALAPPVAPHIAASEAGIELNLQQLDSWLSSLSPPPAGTLTVIEGAGGWMLPLNDKEYLSDWVLRQNIPVILVVGMKLGCLNHAMLTASAIRHQGGELAGWIANQVDPDMSRYQQNLDFLRRRLPAPLLGEVDHGQHDATFKLAQLSV